MSFWLPANWPAPASIIAGTTTIQGGYSVKPYSGLNLAMHVGDKSEHVRQNRLLLKQELKLPRSPLWLRQIHENKVIDANEWSSHISADACYTNQKDTVCAILTADCLPLLLCDRNATQIAAVHIGWRGFSKNIIDKALSKFSKKQEEILAWIGPHIQAENYEVGDEVRDACIRSIPETEHAFSSNRTGHWLADMESLVRYQLNNRGISMVFSSNKCTYKEKDSFYSYRRDKITGRIASLIWLDSGRS
jgi:polyphenol oxidase